MALTVMTMSMSAAAQDKPTTQEQRPRMTTEERAKARTQRMTQDLGLSAEQLARVEALNLKHVKEGEVLSASDDKERAARRAEMNDRKAAYEKELKTVLTPEQFSKWEAKKDEMKAKHREKRMERRENGKESLERKEK